MLLPPHVEALRCMMVERLWKESMSIGPLPELMSDIMAYTPKPTLTLDCPMEEIILTVDSKPDFIFNMGNVIYGVFNNEKSILLQSLSPPGKEVTLAATTDRKGIIYFDPDRFHLFVLHDANGPSLLEYDVKASKINKTYKLANATCRPGWPKKMLVMDDHVFLGMEYCLTHRSSTMYLELFHVGSYGQVNVIWRSIQPAELISLHTVSKAPLMIDVVYKMDSKYNSVRLAMTRAACPTVFEERCKKSIPNSTVLLPGSRLLVATSGTNSYIGDAQLRRISNDFTLPGNRSYTLCISDTGGTFSIFASCNKYNPYAAQYTFTTSYNVLRFYPYTN